MGSLWHCFNHIMGYKPTFTSLGGTTLNATASDPFSSGGDELLFDVLSLAQMNRLCPVFVCFFLQVLFFLIKSHHCVRTQALCQESLEISIVTSVLKCSFVHSVETRTGNYYENCKMENQRTQTIERYWPTPPHSPLTPAHANGTMNTNINIIICEKFQKTLNSSALLSPWAWTRVNMVGWTCPKETVLWYGYVVIAQMPIYVDDGLSPSWKITDQNGESKFWSQPQQSSTRCSLKAHNSIG